MYIFNGIIVVEGKSDCDFLSSFIQSKFVTTNGSSISRETITYIKELSQKYSVIVLTDPDFPGEKIRKTLNNSIDGLINVYIPKDKAIKKNKVGVAESSQDVVLNAIKKALENENLRKNKKSNKPISFKDLHNLNLNGKRDSQERRNLVCDSLNIGHCNAKTLQKRLNYLNLSLDDLEKIIYE